ncbi:Nas2-N domain-containing protein [Mycena chlorophos]|uniref:Uncharacterized protein n=2 Tax=Mycena chlorophos TaxID=658473 RepID=A0ABQ0M9Y1_MYCCL|nr:Nas2-N domain-containing protein [Mycena chlorophos]GAT60201.1 predicted protein [Mycena chlorophos]
MAAVATAELFPAGLPTPTTPAETARALMARRQAIDDSLQFYAAELGEVGMNGPLVDAEGYPRPDIDIYRVREARKSIIELRNDRLAVMDKLAEVLQSVYDPSEQASSDPAPGNLKAFAKVEGVTEGSPAHEAGLLRDDLIVQFHTLTQRSFRTSSLKALVDVVTENENRSILLKVQRQGQTVSLTMVPKRWAGRGFLGCHIVPYSPP